MGGSALNLRETFGDIDIYLFDQILKGRFASGCSILDAGCGGGRNLVYFLQGDYDVWAVDSNPTAIQALRSLAGALGKELDEERTRVEPLEELSFPSSSFDWVLCNAVLHFAEDEEQFGKMLTSMWRVLKGGGVFFARLTSDIGIEESVEPIDGRRYRLPDGSNRFLVDEKYLVDWGERLGGRLIEPIKTVNVQGLRCMTNWCLQKS